MTRARQAVRHSCSPQALLQGPGLGVCPVEHSDVRQTAVFVGELVDLAGDPPALFPLVSGLVQVDELTGVVLSPQCLAQTAGIACDNGASRRQDVLRASVVALQPHDLRGGEVLLEVQDVLNVGTPEPVDGLVVIADNSQIAVACSKQGDQAVLGCVGVLILVDEDVPEQVLITLQHLGVLLEKAHCEENQVVEVHGVVCSEEPLVLPVDRCGHRVVERCRGLCERLGANELVLGVVDPGQDAPGWVQLVADPGSGHGLLDDAELQIGVVDAKGAGVALQAPLNVGPEYPQAGAVERVHPGATGLCVPHSPGQALSHFTGRFVGEGDSEDSAWMDALSGGQVQDPVDEDPRLARPGPRQNKERAVEIGGGLVLFWI
jgi:hypothetical protein